MDPRIRTVPFHLRRFVQFKMSQGSTFEEAFKDALNADEGLKKQQEKAKAEEKEKAEQQRRAAVEQQRISAEQQRRAEEQRRAAAAAEEQRRAASAAVQQGNCTTYIEKAKKLLKEFNVEKTKIEKDIEKYANERAQAEKIAAEKNAAQKAACSSYAAYADKVKNLLEKFISEESSNINKGLPASFRSGVATSPPAPSAPEINNVSSPPSKPPANASAPPVNKKYNNNVGEEDPTVGGRRKTRGNHKRGYKRNYKRKGTRKMRR